jgi:hypothetical protein
MNIIDEIYEIRVVELAIHGNVKKNPCGYRQDSESEFYPKVWKRWTRREDEVGQKLGSES